MIPSAEATATRHLISWVAPSPQPLSARNSSYARGASPALTTRYAYTFSVAGPHHPSANDLWHKVGATGRHGKAVPPPTGQPHPLLYATPLPGVSRPTTGSDDPRPASFRRHRCRSNLCTVDRHNMSPRVRPSTRDATVPDGDSFLILPWCKTLVTLHGAFPALFRSLAPQSNYVGNGCSCSLASF